MSSQHTDQLWPQCSCDPSPSPVLGPVMVTTLLAGGTRRSRGWGRPARSRLPLGPAPPGGCAQKVGTAAKSEAKGRSSAVGGRGSTQAAAPIELDAVAASPAADGLAVAAANAAEAAATEPAPLSLRHNGGDASAGAVEGDKEVPGSEQLMIGEGGHDDEPDQEHPAAAVPVEHPSSRSPGPSDVEGSPRAREALRRRSARPKRYDPNEAAAQPQLLSRGASRAAAPSEQEPV